MKSPRTKGQTMKHHKLTFNTADSIYEFIVELSEIIPGQFSTRVAAYHKDRNSFSLPIKYAYTVQGLVRDLPEGTTNRAICDTLEVMVASLQWFAK